MRIAVETGTHSPWVSRQLAEYGHDVLVANSRKLRLIYENPSKDDRVDARYLARLARFEPGLLSPVQHRDASSQRDMALLRSREALVVARTLLVNHVRGVVKSFGKRLPACSTGCFSKAVSKQIPELLEPVLLPVLEQIASLTEQIKGLNQKIQALADDHYPQTRLLRQVKGIGPITSLAFVLTLETHGALARVGQSEPSWVWFPEESSRVIPILKDGSPSRGTRGCAVFSSMPPTTSSGPSVRTATCAASARKSLPAAESSPRRKPSSLSLASWPSCSITSGAPAEAYEPLHQQARRAKAAAA